MRKGTSHRGSSLVNKEACEPQECFYLCFKKSVKMLVYRLALRYKLLMNDYLTIKKSKLTCFLSSVWLFLVLVRMEWAIPGSGVSFPDHIQRFSSPVPENEAHFQSTPKFKTIFRPVILFILRKVFHRSKFNCFLSILTINRSKRILDSGDILINCCS